MLPVVLASLPYGIGAHKLGYKIVSGKHPRCAVGGKIALVDAGCDQRVVKFRASLRATVVYREADTIPITFPEDGKQRLQITFGQ